VSGKPCIAKEINMRGLTFFGLLLRVSVLVSYAQPDSMRLWKGGGIAQIDSAMWLPIDIRWRESLSATDSLTYAVLSHPQGSTGSEVVPQLASDSISVWALDTLLWFSADSGCSFAAYLLQMNKKDSSIEVIHLLPAGGDSHRGVAHHGHWTRAGNSLFSLVSEQGGTEGVDGPWRAFAGTKRQDWMKFHWSGGNIDRVMFNNRVYRPQVLRIW
jgi:hypothetical protein